MYIDHPNLRSLDNQAVKLTIESRVKSIYVLHAKACDEVRHKLVPVLLLYVGSDNDLHLFVLDRRLCFSASTFCLDISRRPTPPLKTLLRASTPAKGCWLWRSHGAKFSSVTWDATGTVKTLVDQGFDVYAIDLPGYGRSQGKVDAIALKV